MKGLAELNLQGCVWEDSYQSPSYCGAVPVKPNHLAFLPAVDFSISRKSLFIFLAQAFGPFFKEWKEKLIVIYVRNYISHKAIRKKY